MAEQRRESAAMDAYARAHRDPQRMHRWLKFELETRKLSRADFAELLGISYTMVSRWLDDDPRRRKLPSPDNCRRIAAGLGKTEIFIFRLAGYLSEVDVTIHRPPHDEEIRVLASQLKRIGRGVSTENWRVVRTVLQGALNSASQLADELEHQEREREREQRRNHDDSGE